MSGFPNNGFPNNSSYDADMFNTFMGIQSQAPQGQGQGFQGQGQGFQGQGQGFQGQGQGFQGQGQGFQGFQGNLYATGGAGPMYSRHTQRASPYADSTQVTSHYRARPAQGVKQGELACAMSNVMQAAGNMSYGIADEVVRRAVGIMGKGTDAKIIDALTPYEVRLKTLEDQNKKVQVLDANGLTQDEANAATSKAQAQTILDLTQQAQARTLQLQATNQQVQDLTQLVQVQGQQIQTQNQQAGLFTQGLQAVMGFVGFQPQQAPQVPQVPQVQQGAPQVPQLPQVPQVPQVPPPQLPQPAPPAPTQGARDAAAANNIPPHLAHLRQVQLANGGFRVLAGQALIARVAEVKLAFNL
jgi:hypothetical protein